MKISGFKYLSLWEIMKRKNAWNIRHLVDESFFPSTQGASVSYWGLSEFAHRIQQLIPKLRKSKFLQFFDQLENFNHFS